MEPHGLSPTGRLRPDMQIVFPGQHILTDVVISHPLCPTHLPAAASSERAARAAQRRASDNAAPSSSPRDDSPSARVANKQAQGKLDKYQHIASYHNAELLPFSLETTGGMGK